MNSLVICNTNVGHLLRDVLFRKIEPVTKEAQYIDYVVEFIRINSSFSLG